MDETTLLNQLHDLSRELGAEINVETVYWEQERGHTSVTVENPRVSMWWSRDGRRVLLIHQTRPQPPDLPGVELLVADKRQKFDLLAVKRTAWTALASWFWTGRLQSASAALGQKWLFRTGPADQRDAARVYLQHTSLDGGFAPLDVRELRKIEFQEGVGLSAYYQPSIAPRLLRAWVEVQTGAVDRLLTEACGRAGG